MIHILTHAIGSYIYVNNWDTVTSNLSNFRSDYEM